MAAMLVFKLSCKLAMGYVRGQTLEKRQIAGNRFVEMLKNMLDFRMKYFYNNFISLIAFNILTFY